MNNDAQAVSADSMKLFRFPSGLEVWGAPESGAAVRFLHRELFENRGYESQGVVVKNGDTIFDVGANIGMFALSLMSRFEDLNIYCFEPVPATFNCLKRNTAEYPRAAKSRVTALGFGLGASETDAMIEYFAGSPVDSTLYPKEKRKALEQLLDGIKLRDLWRMNKLRAVYLAPLFPFRKQIIGPAYARLMSEGKSVSCQIKTISWFIDEHAVERIDLLKIDVEGAEMEVLKGLEERHWQRIQQVAMEIHPENKHHVDRICDDLRSRGFTSLSLENMFGNEYDPTDGIPCVLYAAGKS